MSTWTGTAQDRVPVHFTPTLGEISQKPYKVFVKDDPTHATSPTHSIADRQLLMGMVCVQEGSAALVLTLTQHCMRKRHNNDGCLQVALTSLGSTAQHSIGT